MHVVSRVSSLLAVYTFYTRPVAYSAEKAAQLPHGERVEYAEKVSQSFPAVVLSGGSRNFQKGVPCNVTLSNLIPDLIMRGQMYSSKCPRIYESN